MANPHQNEIDALQHDIDNCLYLKKLINTQMQWRHKKPLVVLGVLSARIVQNNARVVKLLQKGGVQ